MTKIEYRVIAPYQFSERRPWLDVRIEAWDGDKRAGYIKAEWISSQLIDKMFPTVWHYANEMTGWCLGITPDTNLADPTELRKLLKSARRYSSYYGHWRTPEVPEQFTAKQMYEQLRLITRRKGLHKEFAKFKTSVDYVYVGYSNVEDGKHLFEPDEENYRGRGIGTRLYHLMAMWVAVNLNSALHCSTVISGSAKSVWSKMRDEGAPIYKVRRPETNRYTWALDYTQTPVLMARAQRTINALSVYQDNKNPTFVDFRKAA